MSEHDERDWRPFYTQEAARYDSTRYGGRYGQLFDQLHREAIMTLVRSSTAGATLEVAAGTGHTSAILASLGCNLTALDLTEAMLMRARARLDAQQLPLSVTVGSAFQLPFGDRVFSLVVSTRFLHLWPDAEQRRLLAEMARVLKPGGSLVVDFDNWSHRTALQGPIALYQLLRGKARQVGEHYNRLRTTVTAIESLGLRVVAVRGVGGYHLVAAALLSQRLGAVLGRLHVAPPLRLLAEQFMVCARKL